MSINFKVTGEVDTSVSTIPMTDHSFPIHTVTDQEVGKSIVFTVPADEVLGLQAVSGEHYGVHHSNCRKSNYVAAIDRISIVRFRYLIMN
ncbi:hypothetical protein ACLEX4_20925 [Pseudescherichia vulneris]